jgi:tryptophan synthase beta subunit
MRLAREVEDGTTILINLSGRGDKDVQSVVEALR